MLSCTGPRRAEHAQRAAALDGWADNRGGGGGGCDVGGEYDLGGDGDSRGAAFHGGGPAAGPGYDLSGAGPGQNYELGPAPRVRTLTAPARFVSST